MAAANILINVWLFSLGTPPIKDLTQTWQNIQFDEARWYWNGCLFSPNFYGCSMIAFNLQFLKRNVKSIEVRRKLASILVPPDFIKSNVLSCLCQIFYGGREENKMFLWHSFFGTPTAFTPRPAPSILRGILVVFFQPICLCFYCCIFVWIFTFVGGV